MATEASTVYVGALWHYNCDPFIRVMAVSRERAQSALDAAAESEAQWMHDGADEEDCDAPDAKSDDCHCGDDIMTGGIFPETLAAFPLTEEEYRDLSRDGYAYLSS